MIIDFIFIIISLILAYKYFTKNNSYNKKLSNNNNNSQNTKLTIILGLAAGLMATVTAGLAIMIIPAVKSAGTSTYVLCIMSIISLIAHLFTSSVA